MGRFPAGRVPLSSRTLWKRQHPLGTITKVAFVSEPGAHALAYVCVPRSASPPHRFMICLQGHSTGMHVSVGLSEDEQEFVTPDDGDRAFALECLARGIPALALEQRSLGQRRERLQARRSFHNDCHDAAMRALMLGRTLLGERVYDVDRAIDYLATRKDTDTSWIGVMGNSGGGTVATYAGAVLQRVRFVMPSCSFGTLRDSIMTIHHCADNYVPGLYELCDVSDVLGLCAPDPVVVVAGKDDAIFPLRGVRTGFTKLARIYRAAGASDRARLVVGTSGHRFYASEAFEAAAELLPHTPAP
jgi:hypothetical protein